MAKVKKIVAEYRKQRKRVLNYISRAKKKGYTFDIEIPSIPKNPTRKDVNFFAKITPEKLRIKGVYVSEDTGEVEAAQEAFKRKRKEAAKKAALTRKRVDADEFYDNWYSDRDYDYADEPLEGSDYLIDQFESLLNPDRQRFYRRKRAMQIASERKAQAILNALHSAINRDGRQAVANRLAENWEEIEENISHMMYGYTPEEIDGAYTEILSVINGRALTINEAKEIGEIEDADFSTY